MRTARFLGLSIAAAVCLTLASVDSKADPITITGGTGVTEAFNPEGGTGGVTDTKTTSFTGPVVGTSQTATASAGGTTNTATTTYNLVTSAPAPHFGFVFDHVRQSGQFGSYAKSEGDIFFTAIDDGLGFHISALYGYSNPFASLVVQLYDSTDTSHPITLFDYSHDSSTDPAENPFQIFVTDTGASGFLTQGHNYDLHYFAEIESVSAPQPDQGATGNGNLNLAFDVTNMTPAVPLPSTIYGGAALLGLLGCVKLRRRMRA